MSGAGEPAPRDRDRTAGSACWRRADLLGQLDDDSLGAAYVAQPKEIVVVLDFSDCVHALAPQFVDDGIQAIDDVRASVLAV